MLLNDRKSAVELLEKVLTYQPGNQAARSKLVQARATQ